MKPPAGMFTPEQEAVVAQWERWRMRVGDRCGSPAGYATGCRCTRCLTDRRSRQNTRRARLAGSEPSTHGITGYTIYRCRCDDCRAANSEKDRRARARLRGTPPSSHGLTGYGTYACRCPICKAAWADKHKEIRARMREREPRSHGRFAYEVNGCRCEICTAANLAHNALRRERRKAASV